MDLIIYGAGRYAERTCRFLRRIPNNNILFVVDRDENKQGKKMFCGFDVMPVSVLEECDRNTCIVVSVRDSYDEITDMLGNLGYHNISFGLIKECDDNKERRNIYDVLHRNRCLNLGQMLKENGELCLNELPINGGGGSGMLDYAFLIILANKLNLKTYMEIGTNIGTSINVMSYVCDDCYGITAPIGSRYSMRQWCIDRDMPDFSSALIRRDNIHITYCDSKRYDFSKIGHDIDIFFIDGDHSYSGVCCDTKNVFSVRKDNSIVVWHDFKHALGGDDVVLAVRDVLEEEFENVFVTDSNICGVYIPPFFQDLFPMTQRKYTDDVNMLVTCDLVIKPPKH